MDLLRWLVWSEYVGDGAELWLESKVNAATHAGPRAEPNKTLPNDHGVEDHLVTRQIARVLNNCDKFCPASQRSILLK